MPNRIIKESIKTSVNLNNLSVEAENLFYRLIVSCDDHGTLPAHPSIVRAACFPLRTDDINMTSITAWLSELQENGILTIYTVAGADYLQFINWQKHQRIRAAKSKYPQPYDGVIKHLRTSADKCAQMSASKEIRESVVQESVVQESYGATAPSPSEEKPECLCGINDRTNPDNSLEDEDEEPRENGIDPEKENEMKKVYGEFLNVRLTDDELSKLVERFNGQHGEKIQALSEYKKSKNKRYDSDYATILSWDRKDQKEKLAAKERGVNGQGNDSQGGRGIGTIPGKGYGSHQRPRALPDRSNYTTPEQWAAQHGGGAS